MSRIWLIASSECRSAPAPVNHARADPLFLRPPRRHHGRQYQPPGAAPRQHPNHETRWPNPAASASTTRSPASIPAPSKTSPKPNPSNPSSHRPIAIAGQTRRPNHRLPWIGKYHLAAKLVQNRLYDLKCNMLTHDKLLNLKTRLTDQRKFNQAIQRALDIDGALMTHSPSRSRSAALSCSAR